MSGVPVIFQNSHLNPFVPEFIGPTSRLNETPPKMGPEVGAVPTCDWLYGTRFMSNRGLIMRYTLYILIITGIYTPRYIGYMTSCSSWKSRDLLVFQISKNRSCPRIKITKYIWFVWTGLIRQCKDNQQNVDFGKSTCSAGWKSRDKNMENQNQETPYKSGCLPDWQVRIAMYA
mgnify:CR=1 FL=1